MSTDVCGYIITQEEIQTQYISTPERSISKESLILRNLNMIKSSFSCLKGVWMSMVLLHYIVSCTEMAKEWSQQMLCSSPIV